MCTVRYPPSSSVVVRRGTLLDFGNGKLCHGVCRWREFGADANDPPDSVMSDPLLEHVRPFPSPASF